MAEKAGPPPLFFLASPTGAQYHETMPEQTAAEEFTTVQSISIRNRNCLMLKADFSPLYVDYYLHLMQHKMRNAETEDSIFKQLLAYFTLYLVSRPWKEYHAWTFNIKEPTLANYFISGASISEDVIGRVFTSHVKEPAQNMLFAQNLAQGKDPQTSVITLHSSTPALWVEDYYRQSEQRPARAFELSGDIYALITAQPDADYDWLAELTAAQAADIETTETTKLLETRRFTFRCGCTLERILPTIRAMQKDFADLLSEQGFIEISCPRCGANYHVTPDQLKEHS